MTSVVSPPPSHFTVTGRSPRSWNPPLGAPVRCSPLFIYATFNMSMMVSCLWVRLWLWARGLGSPHLFLTCSGGGGGPASSLSPLLLGSFTCFRAGCGACLMGVGGTPFLFGILLAINFTSFSAFCLFYLSFYCVSLPNVFPVGLCILDT